MQTFEKTHLSRDDDSLDVDLMVLPSFEPRRFLTSSLKFLLFGSLTAVLFTRADALDIFQATPTLNALYTDWKTNPPSGSSITRNTSPTFVGAGFDLSMVGWKSGTGVASANVRAFHIATISPLHFYTAAHANMQNGSVICFVNRGGVVVLRTVASSGITFSRDGSSTMYQNDLSAGTFSRPLEIGDAVSVSRILDVATQNYANLPMLVTGSEVSSWNATIGDRGTLLAVDKVAPGNGGSAITLFYPVFTGFATVPGTDLGAQSGDSGSPVFITTTTPSGRREATLAGAWWTGGGAGTVLPNLPSSPNTSITTPYGSGFYDPVTPINSYLKSTGYALKWTIYDNPSDASRTALQWQGTSGDGKFSTPSNWRRGGQTSVQAPSGPVLFDESAASSARSITVDSPSTVRGILFKTSVGAQGFRLAGPSTLSIDYTGIRNESSAAQTLEMPLILSASQNWEAENGDLIINSLITTTNTSLLVVGGAQNTLLNNAVSGDGALGKDDAGTLSINATCTYTGNTFIHEGTVRLLSQGALPSTSVKFIGSQNATLDLNGKSQMFSGISSEFGSKGRIMLGAGGRLICNNSVDASYGGSISGIGSITKNGNGAWTIAGNVDCVGNLTVNGGRLIVNGNLTNLTGVSVANGTAFSYGGIATLNAPVILENGASFFCISNASYNGNLSGNGTIGGGGVLQLPAVLAVGAGTLLSPGDAVGTLYSSSQDWRTGGVYLCEINDIAGVAGGTSGWDLVSIKGTLATGNVSNSFVVRLSAAGPLPGWDASKSYSWKIAEASDGITGFSSARFAVDATGFAAVNPIGSGSFSLTQNGNTLQLNFVPGVAGDFTAGASSVTSGLLAFWRLNESGTSSFTDSSGGSRTLSVLAGTVPTAGGRFGGGLNFDGSNSAGATFNCPALTSFTLSAWVRLDARGTFPRVLEAGAFRVLLRSDYPYLGFSCGRTGVAGDWYATSPQIDLGTWYQIVVAYDSSSTSNVPSLYVNGVKRTLTTVAAPVGNSTGTSGVAYIGNRADGQRPLTGRIDQVRLFNRVVSDAEAALLYADSDLDSPQNLAAAPTANGIYLSWNAVVGSAVTYKIARASSATGPFVYVSSPVPGTAFVDATIEAGKTYFYFVTAGSAGVAGPDSTTVSATAWTPLEAWRFSQFGTPFNTGSASDLADPDADGVNNLLEYALGGSAGAFDRPPGTPVLSWTPGGTALELTYQKILSRTDIRYEVQTSTDLVTWTPVADVLMGTANGVETRRATVTPSGKSLFLRLCLVRL